MGVKILPKLNIGTDFEVWISQTRGITMYLFQCKSWSNHKNNAKWFKSITVDQIGACSPSSL